MHRLQHRRFVMQKTFRYIKYARGACSAGKQQHSVGFYYFSAIYSFVSPAAFGFETFEIIIRFVLSPYFLSLFLFFHTFPVIRFLEYIFICLENKERLPKKQRQQMNKQSKT